MLNENKILLVSLDFPLQGGGQGICVENIASELTQKGYNATVLTTKFSRNKKYNFKIKEIFYRGQNPIIFLFLSYLYYFFNLKKENYSIIHGNSINHLLFLPFKNRKIKYITTIHNTYLQRLESKKDLIFYKIIYPLFIKLEKITLNRSNKIVCVSMSTEKFVRKSTQNNKVFVIENGVDIEKFYPVKKEENIFRFLYVGRIETRKRVLETIKIFKSFIRQYRGNKKIELIIVGDGPEYGKVKKYAEENNLSQVKLIGFSNEVKKYYDKSNCLLLLSKGEGLPLALLEAVSSGLGAIVTKDASGLSNIIQDSINGYIVDDRLNNKKIIDKMNQILDNFTVFSPKSRNIALNYDWSIIINKYLDIYNTRE